MRWALIVALLLTGCTGIAHAEPRLEENSDALGDSATKWAVISLVYANEQARARSMMEEYCAPRAFKITEINKRLVETRGYGQDFPAGNSVRRARTFWRTYIRFECNSL